jgi:hypothetical protein
MLYILKSVCQFLEEENHGAISHHRKLLIAQLHARQGGVEAGAAI